MKTGNEKATTVAAVAAVVVVKGLRRTIEMKSTAGGVEC